MLNLLKGFQKRWNAFVNINSIEEKIAHQEIVIKELKNEKQALIRELISEKKKLTEEIELLKVFKNKYNITSKILKEEPKNKRIKDFKSLIDNDLLPLLNKINVLPNEAEIILNLKNIIDELEIMSANEDVFKKPLIAVGGGFSAGKSQFISSFLKDFTLPIGIEPTTAIPTYVINGENRLKGVNFKGGIVNFSEEEKYLLSHKFINLFEFNLRQFLPFIIISSPFEKIENICFIDTPGYNPSGAHTKKDANITKTLLNEANAIIWLLGVDSNGTISSSDIEFLDSLNLENKKIFIVLNKADLKSKNDLEDILDEVEEVLSDYDIEVEGISAYSSTLKKEITYRKIGLFQFLQNESKNKSLKFLKIKEEFEDIFKLYRDALQKKIRELKNLKNYMHSVELDILQYTSEENTTIGKIISNYDKEIQKLHSQLNELNKIYEKVEILIKKALTDYKPTIG
jgi:GTP-binding protein EngB required for normal cell division